MEKIECPKVAQSRNTRGKHRIWNVEYRHGTINIVYFIQLFQKLPRETKCARAYAVYTRHLSLCRRRLMLSGLATWDTFLCMRHLSFVQKFTFRNIIWYLLKMSPNIALRHSYSLSSLHANQNKALTSCSTNRNMGIFLLYISAVTHSFVLGFVALQLLCS